MIYPLLIFAISFFSIAHHAASIISRSQTSPVPLLPNVVGPVTNLTISNRMIAPDGFLRSFVVLRLHVPSY
jgi:iron transport multicopper oxidase